MAAARGKGRGRGQLRPGLAVVLGGPNVPQLRLGGETHLPGDDVKILLEGHQPRTTAALPSWIAGHELPMLSVARGPNVAVELPEESRVVLHIIMAPARHEELLLVQRAPEPGPGRPGRLLRHQRPAVRAVAALPHVVEERGKGLAAHQEDAAVVIFDQNVVGAAAPLRLRSLGPGRSVRRAPHVLSRCEAHTRSGAATSEDQLLLDAGHHQPLASAPGALCQLAPWALQRLW
mmetsp:Transcript_28158/g.66896  ORF Transcript_28158/g.66896 Transcript_28158/m.66896 type:complete len:233 (+) Transcript_28158:525-1223(+)